MSALIIQAFCGKFQRAQWFSVVAPKKQDGKRLKLARFQQSFSILVES